MCALTAQYYNIVYENVATALNTRIWISLNEMIHMEIYICFKLNFDLENIKRACEWNSQGFQMLTGFHPNSIDFDHILLLRDILWSHLDAIGNVSPPA